MPAVCTEKFPFTTKRQSCFTSRESSFDKLKISCVIKDRRWSVCHFCPIGSHSSSTIKEITKRGKIIYLICIRLDSTPFPSMHAANVGHYSTTGRKVLGSNRRSEIPRLTLLFPSLSLNRGFISFPWPPWRRCQPAVFYLLLLRQPSSHANARVEISHLKQTREKSEIACRISRTRIVLYGCVERG